MVLQRLRKSPPDLVVMGSHGHSGVAPLTLGISLADGQRAVVRGLCCLEGFLSDNMKLLLRFNYV